MNMVLAQLNGWADQVVGAAWPIFWQSSLLILLLMALDFGFRKHLRASVLFVLLVGAAALPMGAAPETGNAASALITPKPGSPGHRDAGTNLALYTRIYRVDTNMFERMLREPEGAAIDPAAPLSFDLSSAINPAVPSSDVRTNVSRFRGFFTSLGLTLGAPRSYYYKHSEGVLIVRATLAELDTLERSLQELNMAPSQINLRVRFLEVPVSVSGTFWPGQTTTNQANRAVLLSEAEAQTQIVRLKAMAGVAVPREASVTTLSGRQAQVQWGGTSEGLTATNEFFAGPLVDLLPYVNNDGTAVDLKVAVSVKEFLGYDDPGQFTPQNPPAVAAVLPLPRFRTRTLTKNSVVLDGQTLVLGRAGEMGTDKAPSQEGTNPASVRTSPRAATDMDLVLFITPTLVDSAGNRVRK